MEKDAEVVKVGEWRVGDRKTGVREVGRKGRRKEEEGERGKGRNMQNENWG